MFVVAGSVLELVTAAFVASFALAYKDRPLAATLFVVLVSVCSDGSEAWLEFRKCETRYGQTERRKAAEFARGHRERSGLLRLTVLVVCLALVASATLVPDSTVRVACAVGALVFAIYGSRFFFRACEPPDPGRASS
jgi:hypothetical protein